jgi:hypothetical protein
LPILVGGFGVSERPERHAGVKPTPPLYSSTLAESGRYHYGPEQFRLQHGLGLEPENQAALDAGNRHHARKAVVEWIAGVAIALGWVLAVLATVALLLLLRRWV